MSCRNKLAISMLCLGPVLYPASIEAQVCPDNRPIVVLHCGSDTVIRCNHFDLSCPQSKTKIVVVPHIVTKTVVIKVKPKPNPLGFLFRH